MEKTAKYLDVLRKVDQNKFQSDVRNFKASIFGMHGLEVEVSVIHIDNFNSRVLYDVIDTMLKKNGYTGGMRHEKQTDILSWHRYTFYKMCRDHRIPLSQIERLTHKNHATIINGVRRAKNFIETNDEKFLEIYRKIEEEYKFTIIRRIHNEPVTLEHQETTEV